MEPTKKQPSPTDVVPNWKRWKERNLDGNQTEYHALYGTKPSRYSWQFSVREERQVNPDTFCACCGARALNNKREQPFGNGIDSVAYYLGPMHYWPKKIGIFMVLNADTKRAMGLLQMPDDCEAIELQDGDTTHTLMYRKVYDENV